MTLLQSLIPSNFVKKPTKKIIRRQKLYLKNKKKAQINRRVEQLMVEQLTRQATKHLFITPTDSMRVDLNDGSHPHTRQDSDTCTP